MRPAARLAPLALLASGLLAPALAGATPGTDGRPIAILYDTQESVLALTHPASGSPLGPARGAFRQDPGPGGLFTEDGSDADHRVGKVSDDELLPLSAQAMAERLRREIDSPRFGSTSRLVTIDEIGNRFNDGRARISYSTHNVRGRTIRVASYNRLVVTRDGWRVERGPAPLPTLDPRSPGARLSRAMALLAVPSPYGGTYAERVHLYIAPAFATSIAGGRGPHRHLGRDGKPHRATWRGVMPALAGAGGVWVEMYHHSRARGLYPFSAREWRSVPPAFAAYHRRFGGSPGRLHMVFTGGITAPAGAPRSCGAPMACQWSLARATLAGRAMLGNGSGAYRLGAEAPSFLAEYNTSTPG